MLASAADPFAKLRGRTLPYDARESDGPILRDRLHLTDIYSFGLLIWRVALDGEDPFAHPEYSDQGSSRGRRVYNHGKIRVDKRNGALLDHALATLRDARLQLLPETADAFGQALRIALRHDPSERDLHEIIRGFEENRWQVDFGPLYTG
jgi:hypothetical protein